MKSLERNIVLPPINEKVTLTFVWARVGAVQNRLTYRQLLEKSFVRHNSRTFSQSRLNQVQILFKRVLQVS